LIKLANICKEYEAELGYKKILLKNISIDFKPGKVNSIIAPVNTGKTLLAKIIAGLESASSGDIINSENEKIIFIPSKPSSIPWLNVKENIILGLSNYEPAEIHNIINLVELDGYENHQPKENSLGFRFRISLARSMAHKPVLIILDNPFNDMDSLTKKEILLLVRKINVSEKISFLFLTDNISDAVFLSDKIYLMKKNPGEIINEIDVTLKKYRTESTFKSKKYIEITSDILNEFKKHKSNKLENIFV